MSQSVRKNLNKTTDIKNPNHYVSALYNEFKDWSFDECEGIKLKGQWRKKEFKKPENQLLHLEIGPGNGLHFYQLCEKNPKDSFLSVEIKYKPLIQTIKRVRTANLTNARVIRYNAGLIKNLFSTEEINNVFIHFPDPWPKRRQSKHQLIDEKFAKDLFQIQQPNSLLEFKTDSENYFLKGGKIFLRAGYEVVTSKKNLYAGKTRDQNLFQTLSQFELLFVKQNIPVNYLLMRKP